MRNSRLLILFVISFLLGVALAGLWFDKELWLVSAALLMFLFVLSKFPYLVLILAFVLGVGRMFLADFLLYFPEDEFDRDAVFEGCVVDEVDVRNDGVRYVVDFDEGGRILIYAPRYPVYEYGDCLVFEGGMKLISEFEDAGYSGYLKQRDIFAIIYVDDLKRIGHRFAFWEWLYMAKVNFQQHMDELFAEPYSAFMAGLLLGSRSGLSVELTEMFNITGLTHIIAISGYNISLVIIIMNALFGFLGRRAKVIIGGVFILLFVVFVGASAAVVRAAIMGVISLLALYFGRKYFVSAALFLAVFLMVLWNPYVLMYDKGAWLSFLATAGIVYVSPLLQPYFEFLPAKFGLREAALMTISAQVLVVPIILLIFGRLSMVSVIANIFVLPLIPLAMLFGFAAVLSSYFLYFPSLFFAFCGYLVLGLVILMVDFFAAMPFASIEFENVSMIFVFIYYFLILKWLLPKMQL